MKNTMTMYVYTINVDGANPNGDPMNMNEPRMRDDGKGVITQYSTKHKIRNRFHDEDTTVYMMDDCDNLTNKVKELVDSSDVDKKNGDAIAELLRKTFVDIRLFGSMTQVIKYGKSKLRVGRAVAKPSITFSDVISTKEINPHLYGITACVDVGASSKKKNNTNEEHDEEQESTEGSDKENKGCSTMGSGVGRIYDTVYIGHIGINPNMCERNGVTEQDLKLFEESFKSMYFNDESAARPMGTMGIGHIVKIEFGYDSKYSSYDIVHEAKKCFDEDGNVDENALRTKLDGLDITIIR